MSFPSKYKILIVAATQVELKPCLSHFNWEEKSFLSFEKFDILFTGVGIAATSFALGKYLNQNYSHILNVGIAGSFDRNIPLGTLVNVTHDIFSELGADDGDNFIPIDKLGFGESEFKGDEGFTNHLPIPFQTVKGITVNTTNGNEKKINQVTTRLQCQTESMEGAAVLFAAKQAGIDAAQIRSISNYVEKRNKENWNIGLAINNLNNWLILYLNRIMNQ